MQLTLHFVVLSRKYRFTCSWIGYIRHFNILILLMCHFYMSPSARRSHFWIQLLGLASNLFSDLCFRCQLGHYCWSHLKIRIFYEEIGLSCKYNSVLHTSSSTWTKIPPLYWTWLKKKETKQSKKNAQQSKDLQLLFRDWEIRQFSGWPSNVETAKWCHDRLLKHRSASPQWPS